jgi:hypothetical protein
MRWVCCIWNPCRQCRVARWYVFKPIWVHFEGPWNEKSWYFLWPVVGNKLRPFGILFGHLVMSWPFGIFSPVWVFSIASFEFLHILRPFGIFYGLLVISIHTSPCFGSFNKEKSGNPGALFLGPEVVSSSRAPLFSQQKQEWDDFRPIFFVGRGFQEKNTWPQTFAGKLSFFLKKSPSSLSNYFLSYFP